ncbi:flagellar hook-filament junction protein FlgL [Geotalea daltonii FRC-32]|uniref:Flagellar hook-filament junction protein FlgL n=2 Tax=Geotalea TaxID=2910589 RepID=B9M0G4_GEODF|nr:flagellar hook-associated protein FlgL [Geotalea daltonii]ACM19001.1 flagellar hook-filament junction protein FlgL [Geotalea daltonii FRC-32]
MRVTPGMTADNALYNLQQGRSKLDQLQEQIASGSVINRPSDDPISTRQILAMQNGVTEGDQYLSNIEKGNIWLNITNTALTGMSSIMAQVKTIASNMISTSTDANMIANATTNLTQLKNQLIDLGNTQIGNQYVFGGFDNSTAPFDASGVFSGTDDPMKVDIARNSSVAINITGGDLLRGGTPAVGAGSGATAGTRPADIIDSIDKLIAAITSSSAADIVDGVKNMKASADQIAAAQSTVAGNMMRLDNAKTMIVNNQNTLKNIISSKQNVDYAKAATELSQQQTAFEAALSATAKISRLSLLDYI